MFFPPVSTSIMPRWEMVCLQHTNDHLQGTKIAALLNGRVWLACLKTGMACSERFDSFVTSFIPLTFKYETIKSSQNH